MLKKYFKLNKYDIIIAVDKGLESLEKIHIEPDYIVGDFDSVDIRTLKKYKKTKIKKLNPEKDITDTNSALDLAIELKSSNITIIGAIRYTNRSYNCKYTYFKKRIR